MFTYSAKDLTIVYGADVLQGLADGTFLEIEEEVDRFMTYVGADASAQSPGSIARSIVNNPMVKAKLTLNQASPSNAILSADLVDDLATGQGTKQLTVRNKNTNVLLVSGEAWLLRRANQGFGKEIGTREWNFSVVATELNVG